MIFIACPYWDDDEKTRDFRRGIAIKYSEKLSRLGILNYSPLTYTKDYKYIKEGYWIEHGLKMLDACNEVHVLCLDGWGKSAGVTGEVEKAKLNKMPVRYIKKHKRLAFCGSRALKCKKTKDLILQEIKNHQAITVVTHGEPGGVCRTAIDVCKKNGVSLSLHHLDYKNKAAGAFHHRSKAVLMDCDFCIFMHDGISKGTSNELELAIKLGVPHSYYIFEKGKFILQEQLKKEVKYNIELPDLDLDFSDIMQSVDFDLSRE